MNAKQIKDTIARGGRVYGTLITSMASNWPIHIAKTGIDFVFIDTEHIPLNAETVSQMCRVYAACNMAPLVRIPSADPCQAARAIDSGAAGVVVPYVETAKQVRDVIGAVKLRPVKGKKLDDMLSGTELPQAELRDYLRNYNANNLLLVNIESWPAIENLDAILSTPALDGILVGPHDLSCSLGIPEQYEHRKFTEALRTIADSATSKGLICGIHFMGCGPTSLAIDWIKLGYNLLIQHADVLYVAQGLSKDLKMIRRALGDNVG